MYSRVSIGGGFLDMRKLTNFCLIFQALDALLRSLESQLSPSEMANLKHPVIEVEDKYRQLCDALADKCQTLDNALVQSQGVQDALDSLLHWLNDAENTLK